MLLWAPIALAHAREITFYVSPQGNDPWSGRLAEANADASDGPFRSLEKARAAVRAHQTAANPVTVVLRAGTYALNETFRLGPEDSGTENRRITWRAAPGEPVLITGARAVSGFAPVRDPAILRRLDATQKKNILQLDLAALGITDYGEITRRGRPGMELFFRGERMTLARWPNTGWLRIAGVPQHGDTLYNKGLEREKRFDGVPVGRHYGKIQYDGDRPRRWAADRNIYVHGYWTWDWSDSYQKVQAIDPETREITLQPPHHHYGYTKNQRYYFLNILEELDRPGEWYLDRGNGMLYFWPPDTLRPGDAVVTLLDQPLLRLDDCQFVTIQGIEFAFSRGNGVVISGGSHNRIAGCRLHGLGDTAVIIDGGTDNGLQSCDIFDVSLSGLVLKGGDRQTLAPGNNFADNNHIHHYSQWIRAMQYAIFIDGVGNRLSHNRIHDAPHEGIRLRGNEHLLEYNEIHDVCQETGDSGAIHTGRDWSWRGNIWRFNYFHHLQGPGLHGVTAAYLDDWASDFTIYGNIFYKAGRAVEIGGGRNNVVENNIFVECEPSVHIDARGLGWASYYFDGTYNVLVERLQAVNYRQPPYSKKYPELLTLYDDDPAVPKYNVIRRNISYGGRWLDIYDYHAFDFSVVTMQDNLIADSIVCRRRADGQHGWDPYYLDINRQEGYLALRQGDPRLPKGFSRNRFLPGNPGLVDPEHGDFRLQPDSPAFAMGFEPIPIDKIGLYRDEYRRTLPPERTP